MRHFEGHGVTVVIRQAHARHVAAAEHAQARLAVPLRSFLADVGAVQETLHVGQEGDELLVVTLLEIGRVAEELVDHPCKIIILTTFARAGYFERARNAEVSGYLLKDSPSEELASSIRIIMDGRRIYAPELIDLAYDNKNPLTNREKQVMELIAEGKDPIARHVMGGIELGGKISEPILKSIFDPHSPGHDGAVIVEHDQISLFAAHLPLSKDFQQLANVGTRHSAALGLAELSDALCIAVSEERGTISVARAGRR